MKDFQLTMEEHPSFTVMDAFRKWHAMAHDEEILEINDIITEPVPVEVTWGTEKFNATVHRENDDVILTKEDGTKFRLVNAYPVDLKGTTKDDPPTIAFDMQCEGWEKVNDPQTV